MMEGSDTARDLIVLVIVVVLAGLLLVSPVAASNSQGLNWGVSVGQRFDYMMYKSTVIDNLTHTTQQRYYVIIESLPGIQEVLTSFGDLPSYPSVSTYYENGTEMGPIVYLWLARPVGNWSLINSFWLEFPELGPENIVDTPLLAGVNHTYEETGFTHVYAEVYQKSTGVLYQFLQVIIYSGDTYDLYSGTKVSLIESGGGVNWTVAAVGGAAIVGVLIVAAVLVKKR